MPPIVRRCLLLPAVVLLCAATPARAPLGLFEDWAAFRDARPPRCYAIAAPARVARSRAAWRPFAAVSSWPGRGVRGQLHIRLSRVKRKGMPVWLAIGGRRLLLASGGANAWAPDDAGDATIIALMRGGSTMSAESVDAAGRPFADTYRLRGAASAIDAAALGCMAAR